MPNKKSPAFVAAIGPMLFVLMMALALFPAKAQTAPGDLRLTASSLPINLTTTPGSSISANLKIKNDGNQSENLKMTLMKFKADGNTGAPLLLDRESGDDYFDWVTFSEPTFVIAPNEWKTVTATFNVPQSAAYGYYYAIVFSRMGDQPQAGERQTSINGGLATLVLLDVEVPGANRQVDIENFTADRSVYEFLPVTFTAKLRNVGNIHVAPRGNIFISQGNKDVATLEINDDQGSILPGSPRSFQSKWSDGFPVYQDSLQNGNVVLDSKGNQQSQLSWNWANANKLRWGKYTAKLLMVYDNGGKDVPLEGEVTFWVIPWKEIGAVLLVLIFVIIGIRSTLHGIRGKLSGQK